MANFWVALNLTRAQRMPLSVADGESLCFVYIDKLCDVPLQLGTATILLTVVQPFVLREKLLSDDRKFDGVNVGGMNVMPPIR